jgi:hypothetical protein
VKQIRKRLTYANVMSSIAVFFVLGGATAIAATQLGKNTVGTKQLKKNAVTSAKIKNNAVTGAKLKDGSVTTGKLADGSVTGAKVNLATLGKVPSAAAADSATNAGNASRVNGATVIRIFDKIPDGTTGQVVANIAGFVITADCTGANVENLVLDPPNTESDLKAQGNGDVGPIFESNQGSENNEISLDDDGVNDNARGETSFSAATTSGTVISGEIGYNDPGSFKNENVCSFYGQVVTNG